MKNDVNIDFSEGLRHCINYLVTFLPALTGRVNFFYSLLPNAMRWVRLSYPFGVILFELFNTLRDAFGLIDLSFQGALLFWYCSLPNAVHWVNSTCPYGAIYFSVILYPLPCVWFD